MKKLRDQIIQALMSVNGVRYVTGDGNGSTTGTSEAQKDAWLVDNADRCLFGAAIGNAGYTDHSVDLSSLNNTDDKLTYGVVSLAKRMAKQASPAIRPIELSNGEEWYVLFAHSRCFRDFKASMATIHSDAGVRGKGNPLFNDGDLVYDGVIVREIPEIPLEATAWDGTPGTGKGAGAIQVAHNFLCGAQALALAWAQRTVSRTDEDDYGAQHGVAIQEIRGVRKMIFGKLADTDLSDLVDHGVLTVFAPAVADA